MRRDRPWVEDPGFRHQAVQQLEGVRAEFVSPKGLERGVMHQCKGHLLFEPWLYGRRQREAALLDGVHDQLAFRNIFQIEELEEPVEDGDRKSTRLNSSHRCNSY